MVIKFSWSEVEIKDSKTDRRGKDDFTGVYIKLHTKSQIKIKDELIYRTLDPKTEKI